MHVVDGKVIKKSSLGVMLTPEDISGFINKKRTLGFKDIINSAIAEQLPTMALMQSGLTKAVGRKNILPLTLAYQLMPYLTRTLPHSSNICIPGSFMQDDGVVKTSLIRPRQYYKFKDDILEQHPHLSDVAIRTPSDYRFNGKANVWGFINIPYPAEDIIISYSMTSIDDNVLKTMRNASPGLSAALLEEYNNEWPFVNHDALHLLFPSRRIAYQTAPGSPLNSHKLEPQDYLIGHRFTDTHTDRNHERWSVCFMREVVYATPRMQVAVSARAEQYFKLLKQIEDAIIKTEGAESAREVTEYMASIYIWPLELIYSPDPADNLVFKKISDGVAALDINTSKPLKQLVVSAIESGTASNLAIINNKLQERGINTDSPLSAIELLPEEDKLDIIRNIATKRNSRGEQAVSDLIKENGLLDADLDPEKISVGKYDLLRMKVAITTRGYQEALHRGPFLFTENDNAFEVMSKYMQTYTQNITHYMHYLPEHLQKRVTTAQATGHDPVNFHTRL